MSGVVKRITWWQPAEILGISDRPCATGRSAMKSSNSAGYLTAGEHDPLPVLSVLWWRRVGIYRELHSGKC